MAADRFHRADAFNCDEAWQLATSKAVDLLHFYRSFDYDPAHPPLSFVLRHYGLLLGDGVVVNRMFSWLPGVALVPALWALGRQVFKSEPGRQWLALALALSAALSPGLILESQVSRPYSLDVLLVTGMIFLFLRWIEGNSRFYLALYSIVTTVSLGLHYSTGIVALPLFFVGVVHCVVVRSDRRSARRFVLYHLPAIVLSCLCVLGALLSMDGRPLIGLDSILEAHAWVELEAMGRQEPLVSGLLRYLVGPINEASVTAAAALLIVWRALRFSPVTRKLAWYGAAAAFAAVEWYTIQSPGAEFLGAAALVLLGLGDLLSKRRTFGFLSLGVLGLATSLHLLRWYPVGERWGIFLFPVVSVLLISGLAHLARWARLSAPASRTLPEAGLFLGSDGGMRAAWIAGAVVLAVFSLLMQPRLRPPDTLMSRWVGLVEHLEFEQSEHDRAALSDAVARMTRAGDVVIGGKRSAYYVLIDSRTTLLPPPAPGVNEALWGGRRFFFEDDVTTMDLSSLASFEKSVAHIQSQPLDRVWVYYTDWNLDRGVVREAKRSNGFVNGFGAFFRIDPRLGS